MNTNKTVVIDGKIAEINISDVIDITNANQVKMYNDAMNKKFKKSFYCGVGIKSFALGNVIDTMTTYTGIKWLIKLIFKNCGCEKRRLFLNRWNLYLPYIFIKLNLKSNIKPLEVAEKTQIYVNGKSSEIEEKISRSLVKKSNPGCGCNKKFNK